MNKSILSFTPIQLGQQGEAIARYYLTKNNYNIITTNYRQQVGEIDIIAYDKPWTVFIEVKCRLNTSLHQNFEPPESSVSRGKITRIKRTARRYLHENHLNPDSLYRFDVVSLLINPSKIRLKHIKHAF